MTSQQARFAFSIGAPLIEPERSSTTVKAVGRARCVSGWAGAVSFRDEMNGPGGIA
jgi:hypothetical protein